MAASSSSVNKGDLVMEPIASVDREGWLWVSLLSSLGSSLQSVCSAGREDCVLTIKIITGT
jgi:hypothetical protein